MSKIELTEMGLSITVNIDTPSIKTTIDATLYENNSHVYPVVSKPDIDVDTSELRRTIAESLLEIFKAANED